MILQYREDTIRCIKQHDHALHSGAFAHAFRHPDGSSLSMEMILTVAMHDHAWQHINALECIDAQNLPFNMKLGVIHDFTTLPAEQKLELYRRGLNSYSSIHPYMRLLLSFHYTPFLPRVEPFVQYLEEEQACRERLVETLGLGEKAQEVQQDYALLKFLDVLSLFACFYASGASEEHIPFWLKDSYTYAGQEYRLSFDGDVMCVSPWLFGGDVTFSLAYKDVPRKRYEDAQAFLDAWRAAPQMFWDFVATGA